MNDKKKAKQAVPGKAKAPARRVKKTKSTSKAVRHFPIVGLGASAGGLQALKSFFSHVPEKCGMAFIVLVHMTPKQPSIMPDLLQKVTVMPVETAQDGQVIEADHVYVIPPDKEISVFRGKIQLLDVVERHSTLSIDAFLRSLAQDQGSRAVAVVLSGTGTDGTLGIKEIKANDGLVLVQSEISADYDGMPRSAITTGLVDIILSPEEMPHRLTQYFALHPVTSKPPLAKSDQRTWLYKIFGILRSQIGHDFSQYKLNTLLRRINRRMGLNQIQDHEQYINLLRGNLEEVEALFRELLIGVTNFFRDPESFVPLHPAPRRGPGAGFFGNHRQFFEPVRHIGQKVEDLSADRDSRGAAPADRISQRPLHHRHSPGQRQAGTDRGTQDQPFPDHPTGHSRAICAHGASCGCQGDDSACSGSHR
ncbi:MCP methyltransferase/methylesterase, CheR/CheB-like with PAS sensor domain [Desulfosarcina variabilis str. Montpellier]|uniref:chemotaxis protein CheB n=1 Tax=Desulfosarcina variabilis TaxID=2300 RepID=UPI003AFAD04F